MNKMKSTADARYDTKSLREYVHHDLCRLLLEGALLIQWVDISRHRYETTPTSPVRLCIWWAGITYSTSL